MVNAAAGIGLGALLFGSIYEPGKIISLPEFKQKFNPADGVGRLQIAKAVLLAGFAVGLAVLASEMNITSTLNQKEIFASQIGRSYVAFAELERRYMEAKKTGSKQKKG